MSSLAPRLIDGRDVVMASVSKRAVQIIPRADPNDACYPNPLNMACLIDMSIRRAPKVCISNPQATDCILNYIAAFCGDLTDSRKAANKAVPEADLQVALEGCVKSISLGPCVANPHGAACKSNKFAGIRYPAPPPSPGSSKRAEDESDSVKATRRMLPEDAILRRKHKPLSWYFVQVIIGGLKWLLNDFWATMKFFVSVYEHTAAEICLGIALAINNAFMQEKCLKVWQDADAPTKDLVTYDNKFQRAGRVVALVIVNLLAIVDAVTIGYYFSEAAWLAIRALMKAPELAEMSVGGKLLRGFTLEAVPTAEAVAKGAKNMKIAELTANGEIRFFATEADSQIALDEALASAFTKCVEAKVGTKKRKSKRVGPEPFWIACPSVTTGDLPQSAYAWNPTEGESSGTAREYPNPGLPENPPPPVEIVPPPPQLANTVSFSKTLLRDTAQGRGGFMDTKMVGIMHKAYKEFVEEGRHAYPTYGSELWEYAWKMEEQMNDVDTVPKQEVFFEFTEDHNVTPEEITPITNYHDKYIVDEIGLRDALVHLPPYKGICQVHTYISQETIEMLMKASPGRRGTPGTYDVTDLTDNVWSVSKGHTEEKRGFVMSATPGVVPWTPPSYVNPETISTYTIRSRFGRFVSPITQGKPEVMFLDEYQGRFRLLGWTEGPDGKPATFHFDNIGPQYVVPLDD